MREIKFRAWIGDRKALKEVVRYEKHDNGFSVSYLDSIGDELAPIYSNSHSIELMQYTGLKDKNGVEIYEGDVLKVRSGYYSNGHKKEIYTADVIFSDGSFQLRVIKFFQNDGAGFTHSSFTSSSDMEIVGNIYENPELLEN